MDSAAGAIRKPFIEHVYELRKRALISVGVIVAAGLFGYVINEKLLHIIQKPLGQTLFYTSPTGGFSFIFKLCLVFGLILALPVIIYEILKFLSPLMHKVTKGLIVGCLIASATLAFAGVAFAYFVSLPAALHFLANFGGNEIQSLITADEYFSFALAYLAGFAILFQLPLVLLLINRVKPLGPGPLMRAQRYVLLVSFIVAAVLTPTPDPINQALMAVPIVILYQVSIVLVMLVNRGKHRKLRHNKATYKRPQTPKPKETNYKLPLTPASKPLEKKTSFAPKSRYLDIIPSSSHKPRDVSFVLRPIVVSQRAPEPARVGRLIDMVKT